MNKEVAKKWVERLRSGKDKQTIGLLHDVATDAKCCLGVLCCMAVEEGVIRPPTKTTGVQDTNDQGLYSYASSTWGLLTQVKDWAGMRSSGGRYGQGSNEFLTADNDRGKTFAEIADIIEANVEKL